MKHAVILAGGVGTRLWPFSRRNSPKQFQSFLGKKTLLQQTCERAAKLVGEKNVWLVTIADHTAQAQSQLPNLEPEQIISEPSGRNTAAAISLAAQTIADIDDDAVLAIFPSDHYIGLPKEFQTVCKNALDFCDKHQSTLLTLGIQATEPNTGYGYIEIGKPFPGNKEKVLSVKRFLEKPDLKTAKRFIRSGKFLWNSGCFFGAAKTLNTLFVEHAPQINEGVAKFRSDRKATTYKSVPSLSFDSAIVEKAKHVAVIPASVQWSDLGSWEALYQILLEKGDTNNIVVGTHEGINSENSLIIGQNKLIATVGIKDAVIIETDEAILVCKRDSVQDVKKLVEKLDELGHQKYL
ncbi:MAG: sugar phosphate nucleotidyltransferase [Candidatus Berkelbacteria bacterium]|nr:sugar phosphate nucleotidyltransferase [Candidatus Berkelbacteria bacterium]